MQTNLGVTQAEINAVMLHNQVPEGAPVSPAELKGCGVNLTPEELAHMIDVRLSALFLRVSTIEQLLIEFFTDNFRERNYHDRLTD